MRWVLGLVFISITLSVFGVLRYGLAPKSLPIIKPTYFNKKQEIGAVIFRRLFQDMKELDGLLAETSPSIQNGEEVWRGFLKVAAQYGKKFDLIIQHEKLEPLTNYIPLIQMDLIKNNQEFQNLLKQSLQEGQTILIHGPIDTKLPDIKTMGKKIFTLSQQIFATHPSEEKILQESCPESKDKIFHKSCQALHLSKKYYRKNLRRDKLSAALEKFKRNSFTLFIHEPSSPQAVPHD